MKKIMFNDKYGLTKAVLKGRKTMTRRIVPDGTPLGNWEETEKMSRFKVGEVVAVAQSYNDSGWNPNTLQQTFVKEPTVFPDLDPISPLSGWIDLPLKYHKGWRNKMFVLADLMPHNIRITNVRLERLQDITDEDCLKEGVFLGQFHTYSYVGRPRCPFGTPREAFASLIDRISGKGTWQSNPLVYVYEFELINVN